VRILFDQGTPAPLRRYLTGHDVSTAFELGWGALENGDLLSRAEADGFEVLVTTDKNLRYQQNLAGRRIAIVVLSTTSWRRIERVAGDVLSALSPLAPGAYVEIDIP
jgi:predicted nuclease of predicted toxin-antitoxin system